MTTATTKILCLVLLFALIPVSKQLAPFIYYHVFANEAERLRYDLRDYHYALFFIFYAKAINKQGVGYGYSDSFERKWNQEMMKEEGYTDDQIRLMELDAKNDVLREWLKK